MKNRGFLIVGLCIALAVAAAAGVCTAGENTLIYSSTRYGFSFPIPRGMTLFTQNNPGPLASMINEGTPIILANLSRQAEVIVFTVFGPVTEDYLDKFKADLEETPDLDVPGYKRVSLDSTRIGSGKTKSAVEHVCFMTNDDGQQLKTRQVLFVHRSIGFLVTCMTMADQFEASNGEAFTPFFENISFEYAD